MHPNQIATGSSDLPSNDLLAMISNDSPTDLPKSWGMDTSWQAWGTNGSSAAQAALPGGTVSGPLPASLSALAPSIGAAAPTGGVQQSGGPPPQAQVAAAAAGIKSAASHPLPAPLHTMNGINGGGHFVHQIQPISTQAAQKPPSPQPTQPPLPPSPPPQQSSSQPGAATQPPPQQQQQLMGRAHQQHPPDMSKLGAMHGSLAPQQKAVSERDDEIARLKKLLLEREEELDRRDAAVKKVGKLRETEHAQLKSALTREKEEKLAKLSVAHDKRIRDKEDEMGSLRASLTREKDKELAKLEGVHAKQLKAKEEEAAQTKASMAKEKDEKITKLNATIKELKASSSGVKDLKEKVAQKDTEIAALRKQLGAAQRVEDDLRKQQASAASAVKAEEKVKNDAMARLKGSIEQDHAKELRKVSEEHEQALAVRGREVSAMSAQLKQTLQKCQRAEEVLGEERGKVKSALLSARSMAELSMSYSGEEEERLLAKVQTHVQECSPEELHWVMTRPFRTWLAQSYSECDQVCDALESEQQRLKRIYHTKEQELGKMRAHATYLMGCVTWVYKVFMLTMAGSMATGCAGAWRAISSGQFWPSVQLMAFAWLVLLATALILLYFGDGSSSAPLTPPPPPPPLRSSPNGSPARNGDGSSERGWASGERSGGGGSVERVGGADVSIGQRRRLKPSDGGG